MQISTELPHTLAQLPLTLTLTQSWNDDQKLAFDTPTQYTTALIRFCCSSGGLFLGSRTDLESQINSVVSPVSSSLWQFLCLYFFMPLILSKVTGQLFCRKFLHPCSTDVFSLRNWGCVLAERVPRRWRAFLRVSCGLQWEWWVTWTLVTHLRWSARIRHCSYFPPLQ